MVQNDDFFSKEGYTEKDLQALIDNHAEESVHLEFKSAGSLQNTDGKKNEMAKDISSFANSDGGILIYGIDEVDHQADSFSFIDGNVYTKEWIENVVQSRIARRLPEHPVHPVRFNEDFTKSVYIVKIPRSQYAPHMTSDKRYYKRLNFQAVQMEEYEVRDLYGRLNKTNLIIDELLIAEAGNALAAQKLTESRYTISFQIKNIGNTIENHYKLEVAIPLLTLKVHNPLSTKKVRSENGCEIFSIPNTSPLFQEELTTIAEFYLLFNTHNKHYLNIPIKTKLYFSGGFMEKEFLLKGRLCYKDKPIEELL